MYHRVVRNQQCCTLRKSYYTYRARALMQRFYLPRVLYVALCHGGQTNARVNVVHRAETARCLQ